MIKPVHIVFNIEPFEHAYSDAIALTQEHWREIAPYHDLLKVDPDIELYKLMDLKGRLITCTARDYDAGDQLVGYMVLMIGPHPHYRSVICATEDLHFLRADYRKGWTGVRFMRFCEKAAQLKGAQLITGRAKARTQHGALYKRLGYDLMDEVYTKRLDR